MTPKEAKAAGNLCPVCKRPVTIGVMHRVEDLADRPEGYAPAGRVPYRNLIPLEEIIAEAMGAQVGTSGVREEYFKLCAKLGSEFAVLLDVPLTEIAKHTTARITDGIRRVREGQVSIAPGYDGTYGEIHIFGGTAVAAASADAPKVVQPAQTSLF
jgi:PHP family Zn ribbon phosphoesterase